MQWIVPISVGFCSNLFSLHQMLPFSFENPILMSWNHHLSQLHHVSDTWFQVFFSSVSSYGCNLKSVLAKQIYHNINLELKSLIIFFSWSYFYVFIIVTSSVLELDWMKHIQWLPWVWWGSVVFGRRGPDCLIGVAVQVSPWWWWWWSRARSIEIASIPVPSFDSSAFPARSIRAGVAFL